MTSLPEGRYFFLYRKHGTYFILSVARAYQSANLLQYVTLVTSNFKPDVGFEPENLTTNLGVRAPRANATPKFWNSSTSMQENADYNSCFKAVTDGEDSIVTTFYFEEEFFVNAVLFTQDVRGSTSVHNPIPDESTTY